MESGQIHPRPGHQRTQASHEFHWAEHYVCSTVVVSCLQGDDDIAVAGQRRRLSAMAGRVIP